jgi:hypothetical protein
VHAQMDYSAVERGLSSAWTVIIDHRRHSLNQRRLEITRNQGCPSIERDLQDRNHVVIFGVTTNARPSSEGRFALAIRGQ